MKNKLLTLFFAGSASFIFGQTTLSVSVSSSLDDHEERINGSVPQTGTLGNMDAASSDLELGNEKPAADPQLVGMRFATVNIPANANIVSAYIQFTVDDIAKNTDPCVLKIQAEDNLNPSTFSDSPFSLSPRSMTSNTVTWNVSGSTWSVVGSSGPDQRTADISTLVQFLVNKTGWASGNPMAFYIKGTGTREVESFDGDVPAKAPMLVVQYNAVATGIRDIKENASVSVYPNPFKNAFDITTENTSASSLEVAIYDITGSLVEKANAERIHGATYHYASSGTLYPGLYFAKVTINNKQHVIKLISE